MKPLIELLTDKIDITQVPFSDRGSRLLVNQNPVHNSLYIKLAERLVNHFSGIESYLSRQPYLPKLFFINGKSEKLPYKITTKPHVLEFQTDLGKYKLVFQDNHTLCFSLPRNTRCGVQFIIHTEKYTKRANGGEFFSIKNLVYFSQSKIARNQITSKNDECELEFIVETDENSIITLRINDSCKFPSSIKPFPEIHQAAKLRWEKWFNQLPSIKEPYRETYAYAWWVLANNLISPKGNIEFEMIVPSKKKYLGIWLWDNALHAIALRHIDPELARNQIRGVLVHQQPDGMLPDAIFDDGIVTEINHPIQGKVTKPPILAWAALKIHENDVDLDFLKEIYEPLVKWNTWWFKKNDDNALRHC